jgi:Na+/melibiose symporter-like transporter
MLPDTIEYDEMKSGMRARGFSPREGLRQKMAYTLGPNHGFALALSGSARTGHRALGVETGIRVAFCLLPAGALLLS